VLPLLLSRSLPWLLRCMQGADSLAAAYCLLRLSGQDS
jgi:hypothetical protein